MKDDVDNVDCGAHTTRRASIDVCTKGHERSLISSAAEETETVDTHDQLTACECDVLYGNVSSFVSLRSVGLRHERRGYPEEAS
jgi:hypothetical protein